MLYNTSNPHGGDLYSRPIRLDFSANINPFGTPQAVKDAVARSAELLLHYPDPYCRELVEAIAGFEGVPRENILCGNGAAELIFSYCTALKPEKAMVLSPCFSEYETALNTVDCRVEHYLLREDDGFALTEAFLNTLSCWDGEVLMLCNPNNPTGRMIEPALLEKIALLCGEKKIRLFVDECFLDLTDGGEELSLKTRLADWPHVLLLKAFTKSYGMAGLRLGYCLCGDAALLRAMGQGVQPWNVSIPAQKAGVAALGERSFVRRAKELIRQERAWLTARLEGLGMKTIESKANYILFFSRRELKRPLEERGILIRSCANYPGLKEGWYRIAVKLPEQNRELIGAMEEIVNG